MLGTVDLKDRDLIVEAIVENVEINKNLVRADRSARCAALPIASNTSSRGSPSSPPPRAAGRVVGLHFFNPVPSCNWSKWSDLDSERGDHHRAGAGASPRRSASSRSRAQDTPGFVVNRCCWCPYLLDAVRLSGGGLGTGRTSTRGCAWAAGTRWVRGSSSTSSASAHDVLHCRTSCSTSSAKHVVPPLLKRMVLAGHQGKKSGRASTTTLANKNSHRELGVISAVPVVVLLVLCELSVLRRPVAALGRRERRLRAPSALRLCVFSAMSVSARNRRVITLLMLCASALRRCSSYFSLLPPNSPGTLNTSPESAVGGPVEEGGIDLPATVPARSRIAPRYRMPHVRDDDLFAGGKRVSVDLSREFPLVVAERSMLHRQLGDATRDDGGDDGARPEHDEDPAATVQPTGKSRVGDGMLATFAQRRGQRDHGGHPGTGPPPPGRRTRRS